MITSNLNGKPDHKELNNNNNGDVNSLAAILFDLDGVITDTAEFHFLAWSKLAEEEAITFNRQDNEQLLGVSRRESLLLILKSRNVSEKQLQEMMERKNSYYVDYIHTITPEDTLPGARELIKEARKRGYKTAVVSSSKNAGLVLKLLQMTAMFDMVADGHSVSKTKPAPDIFLKAAEVLNIDRSSCAVIEDAASGIEGALAAGMIAVGIGPPQRVGQAHLRYDRVEDISLDEIENIKR